MRFLLACVPVALLLSLLTAPAAGQSSVFFHVFLDGPQAGAPSAATGVATFSVLPASGAWSVTGSYQGLAGMQLGGSLNGPAPLGATGGGIAPLVISGATSGSISGWGTLTAAGVQDLLAGLHYLTVSSSAFPSGELRGQIVQPWNQPCPKELLTDPSVFDGVGNPNVGPRINSALEPFNAMVDCSFLGSPGLFFLEVRLSKLPAAVPTSFGWLWLSGPKLFSCAGTHAATTETCLAADLILPNDPTLVGLSYTMQALCTNTSGALRLSSGLVQWIGI